MKTVIVTGASRGIGASIARLLRVYGIRVVGVARSENELHLTSMEKIGSGSFEYVVGDVCDERIMAEAMRKATASGNELVGLVLNAA